jgi:hypothetical protein
MKMYKMIAPFALLITFATACSENQATETTETSTYKTTTVSSADSIKKVETTKANDGVNVSIKGASIDISGKDAKVETKTGTDIQVNKEGLKVNTKDVKVKVGNLP